MIQPNVQCPSGNQWERFLQDDLDDSSCESIERHLDACIKCAADFKKLFESFSDPLEASLVGALRGFPRSGPAVEDERKYLQDLVERINRMGPDRATIELPLTQERAAEILWLLEPGGHPKSLGCLAHYDLIEILGAGSSGVVFAARDLLLEREVAIKILRPTLGPSAQDRFLSEARAIASLVHDNIVMIYEVGQDSGLAYFTMPWLPGETLERRLQRVTFLPEPETKTLTKQICAALEVAHQRQLVHRDIKPANIWLDSKSGQCKLLDFGLARAAELDTTMTATGVLAGTPSYMSPEQARGEELDYRSDLFSMGCLMYRCMTGRLPFVGNGILGTLQAIQHVEPPAPSDVNSACSPDMSRLISALLAKDPLNRPASAIQVRDAIDMPVEKWPFLRTADSETTNCGNLSKTKSSSKRPTDNHIAYRPPVRHFLIALLIGGFAFAFGLMLPDVLRIRTSDGEIIIETDDPNVQVEVLQDGQLIHILDTRSQRSLKIAAGTYSIQPSRSVSDEATFRISPGIVELTRGEQQIVKVTKISGEASEVENDSKSTGTSSEAFQPVYQGRTLRQWIETLHAEQDSKTLAMGIKAMSLLVATDSPDLDVAIELVRKVMRQYGTDNNLGKTDHELRVLRDAYDEFFGRIPAERSLEFLKCELLNGNLKSFSYLWTLSHATLGDSPMVEPLRKLIGDAECELCETFIEAVNKRTAANNSDEALYLGYLASSSHFWQPEILQRKVANQGMVIDMQAHYESQRRVNLEVGPTLIRNHELFENAFRTTDSELSKVLFAQFFRSLHQSNPELMNVVATFATNPDLDATVRWLAFETWLDCPDSDIEKTINVLLPFALGASDFLNIPPVGMSTSPIFQPDLGTIDQVSVELKEQFDSVKTVKWSRNVITEERGEVRQMGYNSLSIPTDRNIRILLLRRLHRVKEPSEKLRMLTEEFLRQQVHTFSEEMKTAVREGITKSTTSDQRKRLGDIYSQVIINHLASLTLHEWGLERGPDRKNPID